MDPAEILTNPARFLHVPALTQDAWLAAKERQGHPIPRHRLERLTPHHLVEVSDGNQVDPAEARTLALIRSAIGARITGPFGGDAA
jgi:hypothetical protein